MRKDYIFNILVTILLLCLSFNLFVSRIISNYIILVIMVILFLYSIRSKRFRNINRKETKTSNKITLIMCSLFLIFYYYIGTTAGFEQNYSAIYKGYQSIPLALTAIILIILTELLRNMWIPKEKLRKTKDYIPYIMLTACFVLIDCAISTVAYEFSGITQVFNLISIVIIGSIFKNITLNFMTTKYGYTPCLIYRVIMDMYVYVLPIVPTINDFLESVLYIIFPYLMFILEKDLTVEKEIGEVRESRKLSNIISQGIMIFVIVLTVGLISEEFEYSLKAIGSDSMAKTINKGDAIIYKKYDSSKMDLDVGDIIVYEHNGVSIIHRIDVIKNVNGVYYYRTKGDHNKLQDAWVITDEEVKGIYVIKLKWIGVPSVWLSELM